MHDWRFVNFWRNCKSSIALVRLLATGLRLGSRSRLGDWLRIAARVLGWVDGSSLAFRAVDRVLPAGSGWSLDVQIQVLFPTRDIGGTLPLGFAFFNRNLIISQSFFAGSTPGVFWHQSARQSRRLAPCLSPACPRIPDRIGFSLDKRVGVRTLTTWRDSFTRGLFPARPPPPQRATLCAGCCTGCCSRAPCSRSLRLLRIPRCTPMGMTTQARVLFAIMRVARRMSFLLRQSLWSSWASKTTTRFLPCPRRASSRARASAPSPRAAPQAASPKDISIWFHPSAATASSSRRACVHPRSFQGECSHVSDCFSPSERLHAH